MPATVLTRLEAHVFTEKSCKKHFAELKCQIWPELGHFLFKFMLPNLKIISFVIQNPAV